MRNTWKILLLVLLCMSLCGCGKKKAAEDVPSAEPTPVQQDAGPMEVKLNLSNLYDYFEYREYYGSVKDDSGNTTSVQISYGLALRDGYIAANDPGHPDTMSLHFTAEGVVRHGEYKVDFNTLQYSGETWDQKSETISEDLSFWGKGDRTTLWPFGTYSSNYIITMENFTVTQVSGTVHLLRGYRPAEEG